MSFVLIKTRFASFALGIWFFKIRSQCYRDWKVRIVSRNNEGLVGILQWLIVMRFLIFGITQSRYGLWRFALDLGFQYKRGWVGYLVLTVSFLFTHSFNKGFILLLNFIAMTQGQLVGKVGEIKNGEGTRKRLKISVPHFDN